MPQSQPEIGGGSMSVRCIHHWIWAWCVDLYVYAGHVDLTVGSGRTGCFIRNGRIDLYNRTRSTARDHNKHYGH